MGNRTLPPLWWVPLGRVPHVQASELNRQLGADPAPQILDVRTGREFRKGHIGGAVHIPITELRSRLDTLPFDRRKPVVVICLSAHRSIPAVRLLKTAGYENVCHLAGGMLAWRRRGLPAHSERL